MIKKVALFTVMLLLAQSNAYSYDIFDAIREEDIVRVARLLKNGANVNKFNEDNLTPLSCACRKNNLVIVKLLLKKGADVNKVGENNQAPLWFACTKNNIKIVKLLLDKGADINKADSYGGGKLIYWACFYKNKEMARLLLPHYSKEALIENTLQIFHLFNNEKKRKREDDYEGERASKKRKLN